MKVGDLVKPLVSKILYTPNLVWVDVQRSWTGIVIGDRRDDAHPDRILVMWYGKNDHKGGANPATNTRVVDLETISESR